MSTTKNMECTDFLEFQDSLKKMRQMDDKIIYLLNTFLPTDSFRGQVDPTNQCKDLFQQIQTGHLQREIAIKKYLDTSRENVKNLILQKVDGKDNIALLKNISKEQKTLHLLQSELSVEEIVKNHTISAYNEKCRSYYKPNLQL
ncbi:protein MIX23 [Leptopilina heterotoma]|uniref:protein MIX23 n=1 Tax=Leptopilina heterotoma TaxID=63436 RepID=UPI001CA9A759|nr:protein MIX23 [Leptopilina heterotoma]